ncbi:MAG: prepilin peptidase [Acidimicrobiales bacterium]
MDLSHNHAVAVAVSGVVGLAVGSFVGVVVDRVPAARSIVRPGSHCTCCGTPLRTIDNIPLVSFIWLRGRCHSCAARIPARDFVVELATAVVFAAIAWRIPRLWALPAYLVLGAALVALAAIDVEHKRLPTPIVYTAAVLGTALLVLASLATDNWQALLAGAIGAAACFAAFFAVFFASPKAMGYGDVRLAALCGGFLGWLGGSVVLVGMVASFLLAGIPALVMLTAGRVNRKTQVPFGPFLAGGTILAVLLGPSIARAWFRF